MKRIALLLGLAVFATVVMQAQRKTTQQREEHAFEEAVTRAAEPEVKVFIHPLIADLQPLVSAKTYQSIKTMPATPANRRCECPF